MIDLDECVVNALELFSDVKLPKLNIKFKKPLVVGSGNAAVTGQIIFENGVFADESNYKNKLKNVDGAVLISASGSKHAPVIAKYLKNKKIKTVLLTNVENSEAGKFVDKEYVFPKNVEPYTYNVSTYMGMILTKTKEDPKKILKNLKKIKVGNLKKYDSYFFIVDEKFDNLRELFLTKFDELFGAKISGRVFTYEQTKHAKTVVPHDKELFVNFVENKIFGKKKLRIKLDKNAKAAEMMATGYYVIGQIQKQNPDYFKENIENYVNKISKVFGKKIKVMS